MNNAAADESYRVPPQVIDAPSENHSLESRKFQGIPSLAISPKGRLWAVWYAGPTPGEDQNNYVVVATSDDGGATWEERLVIDPDGSGPLRAFDPEVWADPDGRIWITWAQAMGQKNAQTWAITPKDAASGRPAWDSPRHLAPGVMMCKPIVRSNDEWLFPISDWEASKGGDPDAASAAVYVSVDQGETFTLRGAALVPLESRNHDEHMVVERKNGDLWMLVRTKYGIGESVSTDGGRTWSVVSPSSIEHPPARFFICRLNSGNVLLVKHGPLREKTERSHLTAYLSKDEGVTWSEGLLLDERQGISYPDGQQGKDGSIYIIYDRDRMGSREILMARFTEEDLVSGKPESATVSLQMVVSMPPEKRK